MNAEGKVMIILGNKYHFLQNEWVALQENFFVEQISFHNEPVEEIIKKIEKILNNHTPKRIILNTLQPVPHELISFLTHQELAGVQFMTIEHFMESYFHKCLIHESHTDLSYLEDIKPFNRRQYFLKRSVDYFGVFWLLFFSWPIMLFSAWRIKRESPEGPIFYRQKRVGRSGKEFECIKFRSMIPNAEKGKPQFASKDDPRVFKWGAFMRKTRIDELPQIWNILKGEMHLIGPRPERKYWTDIFEKTIPYYNERHLVMPGITGWAQVCYPYGKNHEDAKQKLMYDLYYIKNWSLSLELKIVWLTALTVFGKGKCDKEKRK